MGILAGRGTSWGRAQSPSRRGVRGRPLGDEGKAARRGVPGATPEETKAVPDAALRGRSGSRTGPSPLCPAASLRPSSAAAEAEPATSRKEVRKRPTAARVRLHLAPRPPFARADAEGRRRGGRRGRRGRGPTASPVDDAPVNSPRASARRRARKVWPRVEGRARRPDSRLVLHHDGGLAGDGGRGSSRRCPRASPQRPALLSACRRRAASPRRPHLHDLGIAGAAGRSGRAGSVPRGRRVRQPPQRRLVEGADELYLAVARVDSRLARLTAESTLGARQSRQAPLHEKGMPRRVTAAGGEKPARGVPDRTPPPKGNPNHHESPLSSSASGNRVRRVAPPRGQPPRHFDPSPSGNL